MINLNGMMSPHNHIHRTWGAIVVGGISAYVSYSAAEGNREDAENAAIAAGKKQEAQQKKLDAQMKEYKAVKFKNPYENMENVFEDLTVNQKQADFQAKQGSQQRANIMQNLKGAAGSSGIAGLAQSLANQGQIQTQKISASIGKQESANQIASAKGASAVQNVERQGDQWVQQAEMDRQATLLGIQMGATTGANTALAQTQANQMNAQIAEQDAYTGMYEVAGQIAGNIDWKKSDPELDEEIDLTEGVII